MSTAKKTAVWLAVFLIAYGLVGDRITIQWPEWGFSGKPKIAVVVAETGDYAKLKPSQVSWIRDPKLREACKAAGFAFCVVDPNQQDKDGNTPKSLSDAIEKAKKAGLPRLAIVGPKGGVTIYALPVDDNAARERLGVK